MPLPPDAIIDFLGNMQPYDRLPIAALTDIANKMDCVHADSGADIYVAGQKQTGLFVVFKGQISVTDLNGVQISTLGARNTFGERGLMKDGVAVTSAKAIEDSTLFHLPATDFAQLMDDHAPFRRFFTRTRQAEPVQNDLATIRVDTIMATNPVTCTPDTTIQQAAVLMRDRRISCLCVMENGLQGILTVRDLTNRALADALPLDTPVSEIMTSHPITLPASAIGSDVLNAMMERNLGHLPILQGDDLVGIVTQTDLTRFQASSSAQFVQDIANANSADDLAKVTAKIPKLLVQLVAAGNRHEIVTRLITDIADAATRRLLTLAHDHLGPAPVPYLWLACGSQGRQEQTGVSDQDNCLFLHDDASDNDLIYFDALAKYVCDGLDKCGYVYCPGDMMATNPRWRQRVTTWRNYFTGWIATPNPEAQMLASVMFDLRPIGGDHSLFENLQAETLQMAANNSIFIAHMASNSLKHTPPLGLLRGFATIRSGEHKNRLDMKHNGVVPIVDLGRMYALQGKLTAVNTRARLEAARDAETISKSGARDLLDAYDLIAQTRLDHQSTRIKAGENPNNFLRLGNLSDFERSHLRNAFVVVRTMQSALGQGRGMLG
ncbi:DUF294 nucleotidyltransferase-like domain-containing protein [Parasulfitobacter algicola]|uniref:Cyclic nucleotide-binding/CBS domain-containing protein n=1 Tax=Parasulfitobacter algicola TaxID=2614809 RepID=A0ABX2IYE4_9RHOB|nr:DUF294 nucleotidyltransferase-like domain-containing protein [Sulfitobacter algicola]NSX55498.1 cyclic nucleotide-binding/CBS domain-containing protein [Sulfitobacter algicola]